MNLKRNKIVFLYSEIATYFLACSEVLLKKGYEVHVVRFPLNKEAPFDFRFPEGLKVYERNQFDDQQLMKLVTGLSPSLIVCSGWIDKGYLNVCRKFFGKIPTVLTLDNHWRGGLKQRIASVAGRFYLLRRFSHCWVPGIFQKTYALKLGFPEKRILLNFYSCDFNFFQGQYLENKKEKSEHFPKRFLYVGRYYDFKGIKNLWNAFKELQEESPNDWELWCLGTGDVKPDEHPKIRHFGFVQPADMGRFVKDTGVFVLPSLFEPWGVVVHEYAAAGFPLICSDQVGARTAFVENDFNGYIYKAESVPELKAALKKIVVADEAVLGRMSERSVEKAKEITPEKWAQQLINLLQ